MHNTGPTDCWIDGAGKTGYLLRPHRKTNIKVNVGLIISCKITRHKREKKSKGWREKPSQAGLPIQKSQLKNFLT